jgi:ParB/RepB/Spo0J family partition protein
MTTVLSPTDLRPDPDQPRRRFDDEAQRALVESIRRCGVLQPVRVRRASSGWIIIDGERRWRAATELGLASLPVVVEDRDVDEAGVVLQQLSANLARADLNPVDKAEALRRVITLTGQPTSAVASAVGISPANASKLLAILMLPESELRRVREGTLGFAAAYRMARRTTVRSPRKPRDGASASDASAAPRPTRMPLRIRVGPGITVLLGRSVRSPGPVADALAALASRLRSLPARDGTIADFVRTQHA